MLNKVKKIAPVEKIALNDEDLGRLFGKAPAKETASKPKEAVASELIENKENVLLKQ